MANPEHTEKSFDLTADLIGSKTKSSESNDKTVIGQGKSLADLKKLAQESVVKKDNPILIKNEVSKSAQSNQSDPNTSESIQTKINHADKLIELLKSNFSNSRERVIAENKIRRYFDGFYNV